MAKIASHGTRIWADEFNFSGYLNNVSQEITQEVPVVAGFSTVGPARVVGNYDHKSSYAGFFDGADNAIDERVYVDLMTDEDHYLAKLFGASAEGSVVYETIERLSEQPRSAQVGNGQVLTFSAEGSNGAARGLVVRNATISGNGNGTGRNCGATTAGQTLQVLIRVFSGTFTSFTAKIQESQNDGAPDAYADVAGLSQAVVAATIYRVTTTAATEAWKRLVIADWIGTNAVIGVTVTVLK